MKLIFLILGTILGIMFIVYLYKGQKYDAMLEPLPENDYPLKFIYSTGLAWQDTKLGRLRGVLGGSLRKTMGLHYGEKYSEYYARIAWAQIISMVHMFLAVFLLLAGLFGGDMGFFYALVGVVVSGVVAYYFLTYIANKVKERREECEREFPNAISKLALLVNSGAILRDAWKMVAYGKEGVFYQMMRSSCEDMQNGMSDIDAIYRFGYLTDSQDIKKFTTALIQGLERGGGELPGFLAKQSSEIWSTRRQHMLQKGEQAASELLIPIALMFMGVMLIVIAAAMQSFSL